jgi:hypothetical protein
MIEKFALILLSLAVVLILCASAYQEAKTLLNTAKKSIGNVEFEAGLKEANFKLKIKLITK